MNGEQESEVPDALIVDVAGCAAGEGMAAHFEGEIADAPRRARSAGAVNEELLVRGGALAGAVKELPAQQAAHRTPAFLLRC
ncbi:MAG: hypothetical protein ACRDLS_06285 [Solirubrobacteraceae bacterium]